MVFCAQSAASLISGEPFHDLGPLQSFFLQAVDDVWIESIDSLPLRGDRKDRKAGSGQRKQRGSAGTEHVS
jgi:hypothetical protein